MFDIDAGQYLIATRALRPGSRYTLDWLSSSAGAWTTLATINRSTAQAQSQTARAPLPPTTATELRWTGPCPTSLSQQCTLAQSSP